VQARPATLYEKKDEDGEILAPRQKDNG